MVDFMETKIGEVLRRGQMLSDALAWLQIFDQKTNRQIIDWIQQEQLFKHGVDEDGNVIGYYSFTTSLINPEKAFNTPYTFYDTGEFFRSMYVVALRDSIVIEADGQKDDENLFEKYGEGIIGLTEEHMEGLRAIAREKYIDFAHRALGID